MLKTGNNKSRSINPEIQKPKLYQPTIDINRQYVFGYTKSIRNCDKAVTDLFKDIIVINLDDESLHEVPIIWGNQEKAVAYVFGEQFAKNPERKQKGLVDRIILPIISLYGSNISFDSSRYVYHEATQWSSSGKGFFGNEKKPFDTRFGFTKGIPINRSYTLNIWTKYNEHLTQITEQIFLKFSPIAYIQIDGVSWETWVELDGHTDNTDTQVGNEAIRLYKANFALTAKTHAIQPIKRAKTVHETKISTNIEGEIDSEATEQTIAKVKPGDTPDTINKNKGVK